MQKTPRLMLAAATVGLFLAAALATASARRLSTSEQNILAAWTPASPLIFTAAGTEIRCPLTLDGSFHSRTISKVCGQLTGYVNQAIVANSACTNGHGTILTETLPWHVQYVSFAGRLPEIESVKVQMIGIRFRIETTDGLVCLTGTTQSHPAVGNFLREAESGVLMSMTALPEFTIPLERTGFLCELAGTGKFTGTAAISGTGVGRPAVTLRLVQ
jgi:hypothetical protein